MRGKTVEGEQRGRNKEEEGHAYSQKENVESGRSDRKCRKLMRRSVSAFFYFNIFFNRHLDRPLLT